MTTELKEKLDKLVGKTFSYKGKETKIEGFKPVNDNIVIFTDRSTLNFHNSEIEDFFENLVESIGRDLGPAEVAFQKDEIVIFEPTKENAEIKKTLLETLQKVKADPAYIPQAEAVCNVVSQIVSVQKAEIQMLTLLSKKR